MITKSENLILENTFVKIFNNEVEFDSGVVGTHFKIETRDSVCILPIMEDGKFALVEVDRYALGKTNVEIPAGGVDTGESSLDAAHRELMEETECVADKMSHHFKSISNPSFHAASADYYIAWGCSKIDIIQGADLYESIVTIYELKPSEIFDKCISGEIQDTSTIASILRFFIDVSPVKPKELDNKSSAFIMGVYTSAIGKNINHDPFRHDEMAGVRGEEFRKGFNYHHHIKVIR